MRIFKRGKGKSAVYWTEFVKFGQRFQETTGTKSKELALRIAQTLRDKVAAGAAGVKEEKKPLLFSVASKEWYADKKPDWSTSSARIEKYNLVI